MPQVSMTIPVYGTQPDASETGTPEATPDGNITVVLGSDLEEQRELSGPITTAVQHALQALLKT